MAIVEIVGAFFSGVILFNAVPHVVRGICGKKHMTPFSPASSALVNVLWGWINLVAAAVLAAVADFQHWEVQGFIAFGAGGLFTSVCLALLWSREGARLPWHKKASRTEGRQVPGQDI